MLIIVSPAWATSDLGVVNVDQTGRVIGCSTGTADIYASYMGAMYTCVVTVVE